MKEPHAGLDEGAFTHLSSVNRQHTHDTSRRKRKVSFTDGFSGSSIKFGTPPVLLVVAAENREQKLTFVTF